MAGAAPTTDDLRAADIVTDDEITRAADAYLAGPSAAVVTFRSGHRLDIADAIAEHGRSKMALENMDVSPDYRRTMVRAVILLAQPTSP